MPILGSLAGNFGSEDLLLLIHLLEISKNYFSEDSQKLINSLSESRTKLDSFSQNIYTRMSVLKKDDLLSKELNNIVRDSDNLSKFILTHIKNIDKFAEILDDRLKVAEKKHQQMLRRSLEE